MTTDSISDLIPNVLIVLKQKSILKHTPFPHKTGGYIQPVKSRSKNHLQISIDEVLVVVELKVLWIRVGIDG